MKKFSFCRVSGTTNNSSTNVSASAPKSGSIPITVRFNANEESLDDIILQSFHGGGGGGGGDSLSSSPSAPPQTVSLLKIIERLLIYRLF